MPLDENASCTVCIPTYNQASYLRAAVRSVAEQTAPVRLLVSNDASPDETAEVLAELQRTYRFEAVNHPVNRGISGHLQWMLRQPTTPFLMRLDSDDLLHPEYVATLSALLDAYPKAGYAHCAIQEMDGEGKPLHQRRLARTQVYRDADTTLRQSVGGYQVAANLLLFRREALAAVDFGAGSAKLDFVEDYDLSVRLADAGWGNVYAKEVLASYRMWRGDSRPVVKRKLTEVRGLAQIFAGSLTEGFARRGWNLAPLRRRRVQLAVANANVLDRATFDPGEREQMMAALLQLGEAPSLRLLFGAGAGASLIRRTLATGEEARLSAKRVLKQRMFRR